MSKDTIDLLLTRRSVSAKTMTGSGPDADQLDIILRAGARVPDHGKLAPWRFILFENEARERFGALLAETMQTHDDKTSPSQLETERTRFLRAPLVIAVISSPKTDAPIPKWEQMLSAGAVCQNMLVAAAALNVAANWLTEWYAYDEAVRRALGLSEDERVAGFIYFGTASEKPDERKRPVLAEIVSRW